MEGGSAQEGDDITAQPLKDELCPLLARPLQSFAALTTRHLLPPPKARFTPDQVGAGRAGCGVPHLCQVDRPRAGGAWQADSQAGE